MVKFGRKFFFNTTYMKKNKGLTIIIGLAIIIIIGSTFLITNYFNDKGTNNPKSLIEPYDKISVKLFDKLPYALSYFKKLENIDPSKIEVIYPDNFSFSEDIGACTEEELVNINSVKNGTSDANADIDKIFSCIKYTANLAGNFSITLKVEKAEYHIDLNVIDDTPPTLIAKNVEIFEDEHYSANDFVTICEDNSLKECQLKFLNTPLVKYDVYTEPGTYPIKIVGVDNSGNQSEVQEVKLTIKKIIYYTVSFNSDGGSAIESQKVREGSTMSYPSSPVKTNYYFEGWYYNNAEFKIETPITSDITLTAKWKKRDTSGGGSGGGGNSAGGNSDGGGSGGGGSSTTCITYDDAYVSDVSVYSYQLLGGKSSDCMPAATQANIDKLSPLANKLKEKYKDTISADFVDNYVYEYCNDVSISRDSKQVNYNGKIVGYKITYNAKNNCKGTSHTYELYNCNSNSCSWY